MRKAWGIEKLVWATLDSFCDTGAEVLGRGVANREFFRALVRHSSFEEFHFFPGDLRDERTSRAAYEGLSSNGRAADRMRFIPRVRLPKALRETPYAAIHQSDPFTYFPSLLSLRNRHARSPLPVTAVTHSLSYQRFQNAYVQMVLGGPRPGDAIIATSRAGETAVRNAIGATAESLGLPVPLLDVIRVPLGVDTERFAPGGRPGARESLGLPLDGVIVLCLGRLSAYSKMDLRPLLLAFQRAAGRRADARLVLAGASEQSNYVETLRAQADKLGVADRVLFLPDVPEEEKRSLYLAADIFISPSDNPQETFGLTVLEAMSCGLPVIASDFDGYRDLVGHEETGFLVPTYWGPGANLATEIAPVGFERAYHLLLSQGIAVDVEGLADALGRFIRSADLRRRMGEAGRARAVAEFSWPVVIERYEETWAELGEKARKSFQAPHGSSAKSPPTPLCQWGDTGDEDRATPLLQSPLPRAGGEGKGEGVACDPFRLDYLRVFGHYVTHVLGDGDEVSLTESGKEAYRSRDLPAAYEEIAGLLSPETLHAAIFLASRGHTVGEIARRLPIEEPSAGWLHVQWLMKQGLLGVRSPRSDIQAPAEAQRRREEAAGAPAGTTKREEQFINLSTSPKGVRRLVVQLARMGDLMQTRPLLARLRAADADGMVGLAVPEELAPLAAMIPEVDTVIPIPQSAGAGRNLAERWSEAKKALDPIFGTEWDETYVLNDAPVARRLARLAVGVAFGFALDGVNRTVRRNPRPLGRGQGARVQIPPNTLEVEEPPPFEAGLFNGVRPDWPMRLFRLAAAHRRVAGLHLADFWAALAPDGAPWPDPSTLPIPERAALEANELLAQSGIRGSDEFVVLAPGARHLARRWPAVCFGELARLLGEKGVRVVLVGDESEAGISAEVVSEEGGRAADLAGRTSIPVLAAVLARAGAVVANNTGTLHLADAVGAKVVGLYHGPAWCHETSPVGSGHLVFQTEPSCAPCPDHRQVCGGLDCAGALTVQEVLRAVEFRIAGAVPETGAAGGVSLYRTGRTAGLRACIPILGGDAGGLLRALSRSLLSASLGASVLGRMKKKSPLPLAGGESQGEGVKQESDFVGPRPNPLPVGEGARIASQQPARGEEGESVSVFPDLLEKAHWILGRADDDPGRERRDAEEIEKLKEMDPAFAFLGEALGLAVRAGRRKEAMSGLERVLGNSRGEGKCRPESAPATGSLAAA
ncbi:MAG: glycosyltransferase [Nitrospirota bacterium]